MQRNVFSLFNIHRIFLSGFLIETKKETYDFLEKIVLRTLSGILEIPRSRICSSAVNGKEALLGAAYYGNHPEQFTERVSRGSYAVQVRGYKCQEFEMDVKKNISGMELKGGKDMKNDIYNEEAANAFIDESKPVQLYYQASYNQSLEDNSSLISPGKVMLFISRGDKISAHNEMHGVAKRFYAKEECVVYVAIYSSENSTSPKSNSNVDLTKFDKIHQFELYIKRDKDDPTTTDPGSRLYFDVCLKFDKEEFRFEALPCLKLGHRIPEFRSRDEYLVANIYGDRDRIKIGNIEIVPIEANVLQVADS
ncbi:uncharacterized protein EV154DRAFT_226225 [Mucor mucedo]|uniref:uncharacterized protein n=1 Tax=Mucor mucedo TaxID=29922 RepID=UPI0022209910|nr:uncharacterized protein EV154DRAFT_226225 [Mucor mucedo]KAI7891299.1 hypothetical protein EV154DRAFT_226225 [Mucor mucedo]